MKVEELNGLRQSATVDGVLGGFGSISDVDTKSSKAFLSSHFPLLSSQDPLSSNTKIAADCGAGIGRVSKDFLLHHFGHVDLVEQNSDFLDQASTYVGQENSSRVTCLPIGLQNFCPAENRYDLIWCQWVLGHLKDGEESLSIQNRITHKSVDDLVAFFERCKAAVEAKNGYIGVKENVTRSGIDFDEEDSSLTRPDDVLKALFEKAGLKIIKEETQQGFPQGLYPVRMYLLQ
jgi:protein N-terminal methyltransferase